MRFLLLDFLHVQVNVPYRNHEPHQVQDEEGIAHDKEGISNQQDAPESIDSVINEGIVPPFVDLVHDEGEKYQGPPCQAYELNNHAYYQAC
jgi:hypothetical protein